MAKGKKTVPQIIQENTPEGSKVLFEYIKTKSDRHVGLLVSTSNGSVGWSLCKKPKVVLLEEYELDSDEIEEAIENDMAKFGVTGNGDRLIYNLQKYRIVDGDRFSFERAFKRALKNEKAITDDSFAEIPRSIHDKVKAMVERSKRYFKN